MNAQTLQFPAQLCFQDLPVGSRFRFPICLGQLLVHRGIYFKTGPGWYGCRPGQRLFPWLNEAPYVEALKAKARINFRRAFKHTGTRPGSGTLAGKSAAESSDGSKARGLGNEPRAERACRRCGCTQYNACEDMRLQDSCSWVEYELCSACLSAPEFKRFMAGHRRPSLGQK